MLRVERQQIDKISRKITSSKVILTFVCGHLLKVIAGGANLHVFLILSVVGHNHYGKITAYKLNSNMLSRYRKNQAYQVIMFGVVCLIIKGSGREKNKYLRIS